MHQHITKNHTIDFETMLTKTDILISKQYSKASVQFLFINILILVKHFYPRLYGYVTKLKQNGNLKYFFYLI